MNLSYILAAALFTGYSWAICIPIDGPGCVCYNNTYKKRLLMPFRTLVNYTMYIFLLINSLSLS